jgi:phage-related minor tail protein
MSTYYAHDMRIIRLVKRKESSMADRIKGITIELDGDTTKLSNALKGVNKEIRDTQSNLKDVNKLLKMDPGNADFLAQKQRYLTDAIDATKKKLEEEKEALAKLKAGPQTKKTQKQQQALTREIEAAKQSLEGLEDEYKKFGSVAAVGAASVAAWKEVDGALKGLLEDNGKQQERHRKAAGSL